MSHSYTNLLYHLVFGTRHRFPWLGEAVRPSMFAYLGGLVREGCGGIALAVGGIEDHVHLLVKLRQDRTVAEVLRILKAKSSRWVHKRFPSLEGFAWQTGYGAFTVSESNVPAVRAYILDQEQHHQQRSLPEEWCLLLRKQGIAVREEDLRWD